MARSLIIIVVAGCLWGQTSSPAMAVDSRQVIVAMRDGVKLKTTVWIPGEGAYPVVLTRGYSPTGLGGAAPAWNRKGYAFVSQQTRGNGGEDGSRFFPDDNDGYDCIQWIADQPWCNGKVAMWGGSYWGITQWRAAVAQPPALKAIVPGYTSSADRNWVNGYWNRGALHLKMTSQGRVFPLGARYSLDQWKRKLMFLPLIDMDKQFSGRENILWNDYIKHSSYDDYWKAIAMAEGDRYKKIRIPVYIMVGWRDYYADSSFAAFNALKQLGLSPDVRIRVDDGGHSGRPDFTESVRFLDYQLKGLDTGIQKEPPIKILVRHGRWEQLGKWPPPEVRFTKYYLSSPGGKRTGTLTKQSPGDQSPTKYTYDPNDPVLTLGANGSHVYPEVPGLITDDSLDQRLNESRADVLVFTSAPLSGDTKITGPIEARIHAASSAKDTDFVVRLIDVYPDGRALNITEGIVRARFRKGHASPPSLISPGQIYEYTVKLLPMSVVFKKGHRIRVHLTSSCFPLWDRNPNTGNPIGMDAELQVAEQTIYHDREHTSHIVLPVIHTLGDRP
jgi:putative CocE/NonD family hydrolase